jgi:hypothetical protein
MCRRAGRAFGYITDGWINCLRDKGHTVQRWDGQQSSWDQFDPDLYIGSSGHKDPVPLKRRAKVALHVNSWGPIGIDTANESRENISESRENIAWVLARNPDVVFGYGFAKDQELWRDWTHRGGIPWVPMPTAGDRIAFQHVMSQRMFDFVYLGGRWPYKSHTLDKYLLPLLQLPLTYAISGWGTWPPNTKVRELPEHEACQFLNSGNIGPCVSEKHTHQFGIDIPERCWKVALCGLLVLHDPVPGMEKVFPDAVIAADPQDYANKCFYYAQHDAERIELADNQRQFVLNNHTYHHRIRDLLQATGFIEEAKNMI